MLISQFPLLARLSTAGRRLRPPRLGSGPARAARLGLGRHRRGLAGGLILLSLWITIRLAIPSPPASLTVVVAAHDLPAGHTLLATDLRPASWLARDVPAGRLLSATGRTLATPIRAGELVTDTRVIGPGLLAGQPPGTVAVPVRLSDASTSAFVRAGDRVDVLASSSSTWVSPPDGTTDGTDSTDGTSDSRAPTSNPSLSNPSLSNPSPANPSPANPSPSPPNTATTSPPDLSGTTNGDSPNGAGTGADRLASAALVLAVPGQADDSGFGDSGSGSDGAGSGSAGLSGLTGGLGGAGSDSGTATNESATGIIVLAVSPYEATRLAAAQNGKFLTVAVRP